jgi:hypothetical protein
MDDVFTLTPELKEKMRMDQQAAAEKLDRHLGGLIDGFDNLADQQFDQIPKHDRETLRDAILDVMASLAPVAHNISVSLRE